MKLDIEQIKSVTLGAAEVKEENGAVRFCRFNAEEQKYYEGRDFYSKVFSSAGIQMEFETDAASLIMKGETSLSSTRTYYAYDVFANDELKGCIKNYEDGQKDGEYPTKTFPLGDFSGKIDLGGGIKRVRIVFPYSVAMKLYEISLEGASFIAPVKKSKTMLMYGDSITHGYDALSPSAAYSVRLAYALDAEAYNKAIGGERFAPGLAAIKNDVSPDYITVAYGTNDWNKTPKEVFTKNAEAFYKNLSENYPAAKIFAISPIWRKDFKEAREFGKFEDVAKIIEEIASKYKNITFICGGNLVPEDENCFGDLGLHPNNRGFEHYYRNLKKEIEKYV